MGADHSEDTWEKASCALQIGDDRLVPHGPRLPFTLFPEQGPGVKAVSPLSREPRDSLGLLEVEETKRAAGQSSCVRVQSGPLRLSLVSPVALRLTPQLARQPPTRWMSFGVVGVMFCD